MVELIKNAYEAMASFVEINIYDNVIEITDDGEGMNLDDIKDLLIVSHSNKEYGVTKNGRIISGEKGLGFFSVFKFGAKVSVNTSKKDKNYSFLINMAEIEKLKDIHDSKIDVSENISASSNNHGTKIIIENLDPEIMDIFHKVLDNSSDFLKLQKSIIDETFEIKINKLYKDAKNINLDITNQSLNDKIIAISSFDSKNNHQDNDFFYRLYINNCWNNVKINEKYNELLNNDKFKICFEITYYRLSSGGIKQVSDYYKDHDLKRISPLIYFNNVYFSNELYDVEINASISSKKVVRQQVGIINVFLLAKGILDFNSDRTMLIESKNQLLFQEFLDFVSSDSQSKIKELENPKTSLKLIEKSESVSSDSEEKMKADSETFSSAKMNFRLKKLELGKTYGIDEILYIQDCKGTNNIEITDIQINPEGNVSFDRKNMKLIVMSPSNVRFSVKFYDKISNKNYRFDQSIACDSKRNINRKIANDFIYPLISKILPLKTDLNNFIIEFNESYKEENYELLRAASARTLIELMCCNILDRLNINKGLHLKDNFRLVFSEKTINDNFFSKIDDKRDRKIVGEIYKTRKDDLLSGKFLDNYNYSVHALTIASNKDFYKKDEAIFNLLYSYLLFVSQN